MTMNQSWPWPQQMGALPAAPASQPILPDHDQVRVPAVVTGPAAREPGHTHQAPGVMIIDEPARIRYYTGGTPRFESGPSRPAGPSGPRVRWMPPAGPHSVENIDRRHGRPLDP